MDFARAASGRTVALFMRGLYLRHFSAVLFGCQLRLEAAHSLLDLAAPVVPLDSRAVLGLLDALGGVLARGQ
jgi:hypothetical protein